MNLFISERISVITEITDAKGMNLARARSPAPSACPWLPLLLLPAAALSARPLLASWVFMWILAAALFIACKWMTWVRGAGERSRSWMSALAYGVAWPGMDPQPFLMRAGDRTAAAARGPWMVALAKVLAGITLIVLAARLSASSPLIAGWTGMIGLVLFLHFGLFQLLFLGWQAAGVKVQPIMRAPVLARSITEFWGERWNTAFSTLAREFIFRPFARRWGVGHAALAVFLLSGLVHEALISLPARAGFGLPTGYFLLQAMGARLERTSWGRRFGLGSGTRGRVFTILITAGPAFWLFHPPFIRNVFLPMLRLAGAH